MNTANRPCLPLFKSMAEAVALSKKEQDTFYIDTLFIQRWLARANKEALAEYADKKDPRDRSLQTGSAWRLFRESFGDLTDPEFALLFKSMARLTTYDDPISRCLAQARFPLQIEHDLTGDYFGPKTPSLVAPASSSLSSSNEERAGVRSRLPQSSISHLPSAAQLLRLTVERWCDWLDAANHLHMHQLWHHVPIYFDPDVEKRDLASLGLVQRNYSELNDWMRGVWQSQAYEEHMGTMHARIAKLTGTTRSEISG